jgi:hypothetical protein
MTGKDNNPILYYVSNFILFLGSPSFEEDPEPKFCKHLFLLQKLHVKVVTHFKFNCPE